MQNATFIGGGMAERKGKKICYQKSVKCWGNIGRKFRAEGVRGRFRLKNQSMNFMNWDCPLPLTNNDPERALRHVVLGRKNFAGSKTINGADVAATLYTVIESCKKADLQPRSYLKYLINERWYKRQPLSPQRYSWLLYGKPKHLNQEN
jgi:hypothetical protein